MPEARVSDGCRGWTAERTNATLGSVWSSSTSCHFPWTEMKNTNFGHLLPLNITSQIHYNHRDFPSVPAADYKIFLYKFLLGLDRDTGKTTNIIIPDLAWVYRLSMIGHVYIRVRAPCHLIRHIVWSVLKLDVLFFHHDTAAQSHAAVLVLVLVSFLLVRQEVTDVWSKSLTLKNDLVDIKAPLSL